MREQATTQGGRSGVIVSRAQLFTLRKRLVTEVSRSGTRNQELVTNRFVAFTRCLHSGLPQHTVTIGTQDLAGIGELRTGVPTWTGEVPALPFRAQVQLRAHAAPVACEVREEPDGLRILLAEEQRGVAPGQSAVLYEPDAERGDRVLGQAAVRTARERDETVRI